LLYPSSAVDNMFTMSTCPLLNMAVGSATKTLTL